MSKEDAAKTPLSNGLSPRDSAPQRGLTPEQIKNWRTSLFCMIGSYALIMPVEDIQRYRDRMQEAADEMARDEAKR